jgi:putative DNA primase/helicase
MLAENVHEIFEPDQAAMLEMVSHLFADQTRGLIELAWTDPLQGKPHHARLFQLDQIEELVEQGATLNAERRNVYIGAALRRDDTPPFGRTSISDFYAATALWADLDDEGGTVRAADLCKQVGVRATLAVITGRDPHERGQMWWRLAEPIEDPERVKAALARIQAQLGGDSSVVDPIRIMRLAGSIAWPVKKGRTAAERTRIVRTDHTLFGLARIEAVFAEPQPTGNGGTRIDDFFQEGTDVAELVAKIQAGQEWDNNVLRLTAHWITRDWSDFEMLLTAPALTLPGYTVDRTRAEMLDKIRRGREQTWGRPNPDHKLGPAPTAPQKAAAVDPAKVVWRWYPYIPAAQLSLIAGYGGGGKGLICVDFAARLTAGTSWPLSQQSAPPAGVLWCEAEDPRAQVLVPRLMAAGADLNRVYFVNPSELAALNLCAFVREQSLGMIVLSPLVSFLNGLRDVIGELGVRKTLEALQEAIDGTQCAAVGICHLNKKSDLPAIDRVLGSVAFVNFVRSALLVAKDKELEGVNRLVHAKYNLSVKGPDLFYQPKHVGDDPTDQFVKIEWDRPEADADPDKLFDGKKAEGDPRAKDWLIGYLQKFGETPSSVVVAAAEKEGFTEAAVESARRREPRIKTRKAGFAGGWLWYVL